MISPTTLKTVKIGIRALGFKGKAKASTAETLLAFIKCVPPSMRIAMSHCITCLFWAAYDWRLNEPEYNITATRDGDGVLRKAVIF